MTSLFHHIVHNGTAPSREAAQRIAPSACTLRAAVFAAIRESGERGMSDREIQLALGMEGSTQRPRRTELQQAGLIERKPQREKRPGSNVASFVYVAKP